MGNIINNSLAAAVGVGVQNVQFKTTAQAVPRKQVIIATYDPLKTSVADEVPVLVNSPADTASKFGFGFMAHRLHLANEKGAQGIETWIQPQAEVVGSQSAGEYDFTGSTGVAGTLALYIANDRVAVTITSGMTVEEIADAVVAAITNDPNLPVTAAKVAVTFEVTITAKTTGTWGDDITLTTNNLETDTSLADLGITVAITAMAGGAGLPDIQDALDGLGTGDGANEKNFTALIHGYGQDTTTLDAIRDYVGSTDNLTGLYSETVARPLRSLVGDVVAGSAGLTAVKALGNGRKTDRASGVIPVPGSLSHPEEIAAQVIGHCERINNERAAEHYTGVALIGVDPGDTAQRWTNDYDDRDSAVKSGSGTTLVENGVVVLKDVITFSHPDGVAVESNGYREFVNISKLQNIMFNIKLNFSRSKWQGVIVVDDTNKVSSSVDRQKARDAQAVKDDLVVLAQAFESKAWLYQGQFTIDNIEVETRVGADGFNTVFPCILSGVGKIYDNRVNFDTSIAILL
jgi:phage tail sheath gpL-like